MGFMTKIVKKSKEAGFPDIIGQTVPECFELEEEESEKVLENAINAIKTT